MAKRIQTVRVRTAEKDIEIPWTLSQELRGNLIAGRRHSVARAFVDLDQEATIVLDRRGKQALLDAIFVMMQEEANERTNQLLELRNGLRSDLEAN
jgi:hypothetical protein